MVQPPSDTVSPRPKLGSHFSVTANTRISRMPIRKVGSDTPSSDTVIASCEAKVPRLSAAYTPSGMPTASAITAAADRQLQRGRQALDDQRRDLAALTQAQAKVTLQRIADEVRKLQRKGLVQAQFGTQGHALLRRGVLAQHAGHRVAHVLEQHEGDEGHRQHHHEGLGKTAQDEGEHAVRGGA